MKPSIIHNTLKILDSEIKLLKIQIESKQKESQNIKVLCKHKLDSGETAWINDTPMSLMASIYSCTICGETETD